MSKQLVCQRFIFKIHSSRLRRARWNLTLPISEARKNGEVISLADSQVLRWLDELNGITDADEKAKQIKSEIRKLRRQRGTAQERRRIRELYAELDRIQFKPDYLCVIMDKKKDYTRAASATGFKVNGILYRRLLGTNGGIKNRTIVFISERHIDEIERRIENGRNRSVPLVPAKLEAYKALTCSASTPVSMPNGILVVNDCVTKFKTDIIYLDDGFTNQDGGKGSPDEPLMEERKNVEIELNESDGYGLMLPSLAQRWSDELKLGYMTSGVNTRFSWEKGMVFTFDFLDFAENVAHKYIVKDAWGEERDIRNVELILTTSMLKLWDSYSSLDDYISNCLNNKYTFCVTKTCPEALEQERNLNYQFIQSYNLSDDDIDELIKPTMDEINNVLYLDPAKTVLFLKGCGLDEKNVDRVDNDIAKAIMINPKVLDDSYVQNCVYQAIKNRINEAKVGVVKVHGNYSIVCGDPYSLCQSIFGLEVTGLLKAGEIYNEYWCDSGADKLACFRAPMTCHNNIRLVRPNRCSEARYWYRHMKTCTLFNSWDTAAPALNGMDKDGDLVMLTDNDVLVRKLVPLPALMCVQRKAEKIIETKNDLIKSNKNSFGDDIGKTTNWITSMYDVRAQFKPDSEEYQTLDYRIKCGQLFQQNAIDKAKGIISKPMPYSWHSRRPIGSIDDEKKRSLYKSIVADKKPYFMRYIYPALMKQYNTYIKNTNKNALREFGITLNELLKKPDAELNEDERVFLKYFKIRLPVSNNDCVMNRICRKFEDEFDGYLGKHGLEKNFDYTIMKSGVGYTPEQYKAVCRLYNTYNARIRDYAVFSSYERVDEYDSFQELSDMRNEFEQECSMVCHSKDVLCDIVLDMCYKKNSTKKFAWEMCGDEIIHNLLVKSEWTISYPTKCDSGKITYGGKRFELKSKVVAEEIWE